MSTKNVELRIYDKNVNLLAAIDNYEKLTFQRSFFKTGSFTLVTGRNTLYSEYLEEDNLIALSNEKVGIIKHVVYSQSGDKDIIEVSGWELKGLLKQRIAIPTTGQSHQSFTNEYSEKVIKDIVDYNCVNPIDLDRVIPKLEIAPNLSRGTQIDSNTRYKPLNEEVSRIARESGVGVKVTLDLPNKQYLLDVYEGSNLTKGGGSSNPVTFSTEFDNLKSQRYVKSKINSANFAIIAGQGEGAARVIENAGAGSGLDRYETFVDARDLSTTSGLIARGNNKLASVEPIESFDCTILDETSYTYEKDYDLGDEVTIVFDPLNLPFNKVIDTATEYYSGGGFQVSINFGDDLKSRKEYIDMSADDAQGGII